MDILKSTGIVLSFVDASGAIYTLTGESIVVQKCNISMSNNIPDFPQIVTGMEHQLFMPPRHAEIDLSITCPMENVNQVFDLKPIHQNKIRYKKVDDCTVKELLFAVRKKLKGE